MTYYIKDKMLNACISEQNKRIVNEQINALFMNKINALLRTK